MALKDKINTAKDVFSNTRSRMVVIILITIVVLVLVIAYVKFKRSQLPPAGLGSAMTGVPGITSIPGIGQPTREYAKLQEQQNVELAKEAAHKGTSAMPTVVRTTYLDVGVSADLSKQSGATSVAGCGVEELKRAHAAGVTASELRCRGCSVAALMAAGFTAGELRAAGFSAQELKDGGFSASDLKNAGFNTNESAVASGDKCDAKMLREARSKGVAASELKKLGCSAAALKAAGYTASELRAAGFSAGELRDAGFSAKDLKDAGFSASELRNAGFSAKELSEAGFTPEQLLAAGYTSGDLVRAGVVAGSSGKKEEVSSCSVDSLKKARASGVSAAKLKDLGCSAAALKAAGYTASELRAAGFSAQELRAAGFSAKELKDAGFTNADLYSAGFSPDDLKAAGFSEAETNKVAENYNIQKQEATSDFSNLQDKIGRMSDDRIAGMNDQDMDNFIKQQQAMMMMQANQLFSTWSVIPLQQYVQGESPKADKEKAKTLSAEEQKAEMLKNSDIYKAGSIIFATLDTEVNSDENSPITATVIQGPLSGSKVVGNFQRVDKKVLLQFSVLSIPRLSTSIGITAVAMDPDTAKTAMASSVDNHYMLRYGTLLATSFISGLGQVIQESGSKLQTTTTGTIAEKPALNMAQKIMAAMGNVGQQFSSALAPKINTPPTIKVNAGSGIALLLMSDLLVPKDDQKDKD